MVRTAKIVAFVRPAEIDPEAGLPPRGILVGDPALSEELAQLRPEVTGLREIPFAALTPALLKALRPPILICRPMAEDHDCYDLARMIRMAGLKTTLCLMAADLPDPEVVRREMASAFPKQALQLWILPCLGQSGRSPSR
ncbi:hypothetical protein [Mangrovicoccus sp. HB161399]|uniref:hypothetical protein n=1 Tax=Mangrovicoccus sp. HB161399 TaxID=2720392 RepID=UPI00155397BF|nr:hypothetical protein [Mangrovicoccus sp. HB161399]